MHNPSTSHLSLPPTFFLLLSQSKLDAARVRARESPPPLKGSLCAFSRVRRTTEQSPDTELVYHQLHPASCPHPAAEGVDEEFAKWKTANKNKVSGKVMAELNFTVPQLAIRLRPRRSARVADAQKGDDDAKRAECKGNASRVVINFALHFATENPGALSKLMDGDHPSLCLSIYNDSDGAGM